ncbi:2-oxoglutarate dehydrogenase E1 subunit family protein, partial [Actinomyces gerencseriae]
MVEEMRDAWLADPSSVTPQWRTLFEGSGASEPSEDAADPAGSTTTPDPRAVAGTTEAPR